MLSKYWGWCKYWYWGHPKANFAEAKAWALEVPDACPTEVIQHFINRLWRFIDSYRKGLTGEAAAWVVRKQKSHRSVSEAWRLLKHSLNLNRFFSWTEDTFPLESLHKGCMEAINWFLGLKILAVPKIPWKKSNETIFGCSQGLWIWIWCQI